MQLVGGAGIGRQLGPNLGDRLGVEASDVVGVDGQTPTQRHRQGSALGRLGVIVEKSVGAGGQDLVGQERRLGGVDAVH